MVAIALSGCLSLLDGNVNQSATQQKEKDMQSSRPLSFGNVKTFRDGFQEIKKIDEKYNADFHKEQLGKFIVDLQDIQAMQDDLHRLVEQITGNKQINFELLANKKEKTEIDLVLLFIAARLEMLESEKYFQFGYQHGNAGLVGDGFFCSEKPFIFDSLDNFNTSIVHGLNSTLYLDVLLTQTENITHALVGINDNKPQFYATPLQHMSDQLKKNKQMVLLSCTNQTGKDTYVIIDTKGQPKKASEKK